MSEPIRLSFDGWDPSGPISVQPPDLRVAVERRILVFLAGDIGALHLGSPPEGYIGDSVDEEMARQALAKLGPRLAELIIANEVCTDPRTADEANARSAANAFAGPEAGWLYLEWLRRESLELVIRYRMAIWRVADALERAHVLTGEQVTALVHPSKGSSKGAPDAQ